jgi:uncharacterized protein DUF6754
MTNRPSGPPGLPARGSLGRSFNRFPVSLLAALALLAASHCLAAPVPGEIDFGAELPAAPESLTVVDVPDDGGETLRLTWKAPATGVAQGLAILRAETEAGPFVAIDTVAATATAFDDQAAPGHPLADGTPYFYRVSALGEAGESVSRAASGIARQSFFHMGRLNLFLFIFVFFGIVLAFTRQAAQQSAAGKMPFVRKIAGLTAIEEAIGRATEMGRAVLYVPGIDDANNIQTIYSMIILGNVARTVARYETPLIVPVCRAFVVPLAEETVKQGYLDAGRPEAFNRNNIRFLSEEQFAFTAGVDGIMLREKPAANLFLGSFFAESLILAETGFQTGAVQIAGTANIHQLPFFVVACDYTLIGEEFYAASAYLSKTPKLIGVLKGTDWMKVILMGLMLVGIVASSIGWTAFRDWFVIR